MLLSVGLRRFFQFANSCVWNKDDLRFELMLWNFNRINLSPKEDDLALGHGDLGDIYAKHLYPVVPRNRTFSYRPI